MNTTFQNPPQRAASTRAQRRSSLHASTRGFTLLEVLVTLSLMMIMLAIIFVPLNSAFNIFQIGKSRNDLQLASRQTLSQLEIDLQKAVYVFPNSTLPGITDKAPFKNPDPTKSDAPYFDSATCDNTKRISNTARIDMLLPLRSDEVYPAPPQANSSIVNPVRPAYYVVTYYARLANPDPKVAFDAITNPVQLFRAKMPYRNSDPAQSFTNINVSGSRYGTCTAATSGWLTQDALHQPRLESYAIDADGSTPAIVGSHELVSPRDLALLPTNGGSANLDLQPRGTNFICEDTNGDGKIDRVTVSLTLAQYDLSSVGGAPSSANGNSGNGQPTYQQHTQRDVVNLTNVR